VKAVAVECARLAVQAKYTAPALTRLTTPTTASVVGADARRRDAPSIGNVGGTQEKVGLSTFEIRVAPSPSRIKKRARFLSFAARAWREAAGKRMRKIALPAAG
jgi:hypothetical protein